MIAIMFPHRSRHEIRRKFNREDKLNPKLVTAALARRKRVGASSASPPHASHSCVAWELWLTTG